MTNILFTQFRCRESLRSLSAWCFVLLLCATPLFAQRLSIGGGGEGAAPFLRMPVGGRAAAMGGAQAAEAHDLTAAYWNPAGLSFIKGGQLAASLTSLDGELGELLGDHIYTAVGYGGSWGTVALSYLHHGIEGIELISEDDIKLGQSEVFGENALQISYAREIVPQKMYAGITWKVVSLDFWDYSGTGVDGIDIGLLFRPLERLCIATVIKKQITMRWDIEGSAHNDYAPKMGVVGLSYQVMVNRAWWTLDLVQEEDMPLNLRSGAEYRFVFPALEMSNFKLENLAIRGGLQNIFLGTGTVNSSQVVSGNSVQVERDIQPASGNMGLQFGLGIQGSAAGKGFYLDFAYGFQHLANLSRLSLIMNL